MMCLLQSMTERLTFLCDVWLAPHIIQDVHIRQFMPSCTECTVSRPRLTITAESCNALQGSWIFDRQSNDASGRVLGARLGWPRHTIIAEQCQSLQGSWTCQGNCTGGMYTWCVAEETDQGRRLL